MGNKRRKFEERRKAKEKKGKNEFGVSIGPFVKIVTAGSMADR